MAGPKTHRRWAPGELEQICWDIGSKPLKAVAKKHGRTARSIQERLKSYDKSVEAMTHAAIGMKAEEVVAALGLSSKQRLHNWIKAKWLPVVRRKAHGRELIGVDQEDLSAFLAEWGALLPGLHPNAEWAEFIHECRLDLLGRLVHRADIADWMAFSSQQIGYLIEMHAFPHHSSLANGISLVRGGMERFELAPGQWVTIGGGGYYSRQAVAAWFQGTVGQGYQTTAIRNNILGGDHALSAPAPGAQSKHERRGTVRVSP